MKKTQPLCILVSPSGFKECLEPEAVADCIETGIRRVLPDAIIRKAPLHDGGEGFSRALVAATGGEMRYLTVTGPIREPVHSHFGFLGGDGRPRTAVVDVAAAAGLGLVPRHRRDPVLTTTYGVGELVAAALNDGARRIIIGCGDSGTCDGGIGMCQALGVRFIDADGKELPRAGGGGQLARVAGVDVSSLHPRLLGDVEIEGVCNWRSVLCGDDGAARVYGPQKGATPEQAEELSAAMDSYARVIERELGRGASRAPGAGASGGLGAGLLLVGAKLREKYQATMDYFSRGEAALFEGVQLVVTGEGELDSQTPRGKITAELAKRAKERGLPVIVLAGTVSPDASATYEVGIDAYTSILQSPTTLEHAIQDAERLLEDGAESAIRMVLVGCSIRLAETPGGKMQRFWSS
jgi:glycerate 2-kinase